MSKTKKKLDRPALERVAKVFSGFSDATRLAVLQELMEGTRSVGEIVEAVGGSQGNISKQLQLLYDTGILEREKKSNLVFYSIADEMVFSMCELVCDKINRDMKSSGELSFKA